MLFETSASQVGQPSPTFELCRIDVSPCQREVNLAPGEEVTLALLVRSPDSASISPDWSLVAWHLKMRVGGDNVIGFPDVGSAVTPFIESTGALTALSGVNPINAGIQADTASSNFYRVRNSYSETERQLDYAIAILRGENAGQAQPSPGFMAGEKALLGTLTLRGAGTGTAQLSIDSGEPSASKMVLRTSSGELDVIEVPSREPLARVNVGPDAEKLRLKGKIASDIPGNEGEYQPFGKPFKIEVWQRDATPSWQGGPDMPLATFSNILGDQHGSFVIRDIPTRFVSGGTYDLRVIGNGTLPYIKREVPINPSDRQSGNLLNIVDFAVGPLASGDLNGIT